MTDATAAAALAAVPAHAALADVVPLHANPPLPLWMIQLVYAAQCWAEDTAHSCPEYDATAALPLDDDGGDGCDACFWQALYDQVPPRIRRGVTADIAAGVLPARPESRG